MKKSLCRNNGDVNGGFLVKSQVPSLLDFHVVAYTKYKGPLDQATRRAFDVTTR